MEQQNPIQRNHARFTKRVPPAFASDKKLYQIWLKDLAIWVNWRDEAIEAQDLGMLVYTQLTGHAQQVVQRDISESELVGVDEEGAELPAVLGETLGMRAGLEVPGAIARIIEILNKAQYQPPVEELKYRAWRQISKLQRPPEQPIQDFLEHCSKEFQEAESFGLNINDEVKAFWTLERANIQERHVS